ncbi:MAG: NusG domain II-containing protein [Schwartzia sp. (in: firmicutes)]
MNKHSSKGVAIAAFVLGLAALALFAPRGFLPWAQCGVSPAAEDGGAVLHPRVAVVTVDGIVWGTFPLPAEGVRAVFTVETTHGWNRIVLAGGTVAVEDANCPNHLCQRQGSISKPGEVIACLPHRLLVEVREAP